ncbi:hypothetical protein Clacol_003632 [Clathrus columnatus]|uniref:CP-type G domain-containing protein n=1 Tax=Clathrus columnatus TaxID=1419009 RepID=A0AAV5A8X6_9AGAM|nr:hypothetical protein Clacol_003632 [Clathrus columnatus]
METESEMAFAASNFDADLSQSVGECSVEHAKRQYIRTLHKVIEQSDVIIVVLDARDPEGCRAKLVEEEVRRREADGKKLVFVLNKIDLVSQDNVLAWLRYLRHTAPTIPFRSSTQQQSTNLKSHSTSGLLNLIKSYRNGPSSKITVGVVGYPNVCAVGAEAGWTRDLQSVQIDRGIRVIDSPGVIFDDAEPESERARSSVLLRNVVKVEDINDPLAIVEEIVNRTPKETLRRIYKLPEWNNTLEFVTMLSLSAGRLLKGGKPDSIAAARLILQDWNSNKIPYFSVPPSVHPSSLPSALPGAEDVGQLTIVQGGFGTAFDLDQLCGEAMHDDTADDNIMETSMESDGVHDFIPQNLPLSPESVNPIQQRKPSVPNNHAHISNPSPIDNSVGAITQRRKKPTYELVLHPQIQESLGSSNPLGRRNLRMNLKRERKATRKAAKKASEGMRMDDDDMQDGMASAFHIPQTI